MNYSKLILEAKIQELERIIFRREEDIKTLVSELKSEEDSLSLHKKIIEHLTKTLSALE